MSGILEPIKGASYKTMVDLTKVDGDRNEAIMFVTAYTDETNFTGAELENGAVVVLDELMSDGSWVAKAPVAVTDDIYFHCSVEVDYDERVVSKEEFSLKAATVSDELKGRVKKLRSGNRVTMSTNGLSTYVKGTSKYVFVEAGTTKLKADAAMPETNGLVFKIIDEDVTIGFNERPAVLLHCLGSVTKPAV